MNTTRCTLQTTTFVHLSCKDGSVFVIDRCWSVATGLPSSLPDDEHPQLRICSVWAWGSSLPSGSGDDTYAGEVSKGRNGIDFTSLSALFDRETPPEVLTRGCTKALKAKAAALFERAARIAAMQSDTSASSSSSLAGGNG